MDDSQQDVQQKPLRSSWLTTAAYNRRDQSLTIHTRGGRAYDLSGVPPDMYEALCNASSPGQYFNQYLKGQY